MGFGQQYELQGIERYYQKIGSNYSNPHESDIADLVKDFADPSRSYLDLGCGDGAVTRSLTEAGCDRVEGCDPYLYEAYESSTNKKCHKYCFENLSFLEERYDVIICSYALHLLPLSFLPQVLYQLSRLSSELVILTPHKRPVINNYWELQKQVTLNKTKMRIYKKA